MIVRSALAALLVGTQALATDDFAQLRGAAIGPRLTGLEFTDGVHFAEVFGPGGSLEGTYLGSRRSGRWRIEGDGICLTRQAEQERCFEVWVAHGTLQLRQVGTDDVEEGVLRRP